MSTGKTIGLINAFGGGSSGGGGSSLPTDPAQDGTYNLQNTVSSGTSTLSWASGGSSGGGVLVVTVTQNDGSLTADKTAGEIINAMPLVYVTQSYPGAGRNEEDLTAYSYFSMGGDGSPTYGVKDGTGYYFYYTDSDYNQYELFAATLNDYPSGSESPR